ncbi:coatomer subunit alpha [Rhizoclosmatium sp. JEL0117]|nr:coatomer subunit alpha [Rhizoclosmatium sp. JEL0117]
MKDESRKRPRVDEAAASDPQSSTTSSASSTLVASTSLSARNTAALLSGAASTSTSTQEQPRSSRPRSSPPPPPPPAACPICLDVISDAYMTKCGHSFCHECITIHLSVTMNCPSCATALQQGEIYPNISLNNVISKAGVDSPNATSMGTIAANLSVDPSTTMNSSNPGLKEIDSMLNSLIERRKQLESNEPDIQWELYNQFLKKTKQQKEIQLEALRQAMACLDEDLSHVQSELEKRRSSEVHGTNKNGNRNGSGLDTQNVPSTPRNIASTAADAIKRFGASVCSSPLPPELPNVTTPTAINWNLHAITTGTPKDVISATKSSRKRNYDEIDDSEDPSHQPPLEFTLDPAETDHQQADPETDPELASLIKTRMARLEPHFEDLQKNYFAFRLPSHKQPAPTYEIKSSGIPSPQIPVPSSSSSSSTSTTTSSDPPNLLTTRQSFPQTLSRFSKISHFRTLARINYADKLVSGNSGSTGAAATAAGASSGGGSSSIVSAIEFDKDDEFFATAGVTKKVKIYEFESVVKDWEEVFGDGGGGTSRRRRRGFVGGDGPLFVADALNDDDRRGFIDDDDDDDEEDDGGGLDVVPRYPILEMSGRSKISCLSWNSLNKEQLSSSDYEGIVTLWDSKTGVASLEFEEHEKRAWSVDFNVMDPVLLASGSDDCKVKIWSVNQKKSVQTIESKANICSVKWNPLISNQIAFGSADHHIHYYDIRKPSEPLYILCGHKKAVSYVKFLSRNEIVSASTDSTLRLWSLGGPSASSMNLSSSSSSSAAPLASPAGPMSSSLFPPLSSFIEKNLTENMNNGIFRRSAASVFSSYSRAPINITTSLLQRAPSSSALAPNTDQPHCLRSYGGHTNEKNFVGLSINSTGEFISCGSENNSVYTYFHSLPNPVIMHRFGNSLETTSGEEVADQEPSQFVSSVCWKRNASDVLVAANSVGGVKVMKMV